MSRICCVKAQKPEQILVLPENLYANLAIGELKKQSFEKFYYLRICFKVQISLKLNLRNISVLTMLSLLIWRFKADARFLREAKVHIRVPNILRCNRY